MSEHPYRQQPDYAFWRRCFEGVDPARVDPVIKAPFAIGPQDKIVTAGSCFAQHIARHLGAHGFNFHVTERAHSIVPGAIAERNNYGQFSARYGNIYTTAQLLQLFRRAYGTYRPQEPAWQGESGETLDPFRPLIQPGGYLHEEEMLADRRQHLACVRQGFEELDIFVFTLGLTEYWRSKADGAAFPLCPGTAGGIFDAGRYEFVNAGVGQVVAELEEFIDLLRAVNARAKVILTVSPVPLVATAEDRHALVSTTYSKSVLRVAAEMVTKSRADVAYYPSYEIITGSFNRGQYFAADLRSVLEAGVEHVMRLFLKHYGNRDVARLSNESLPESNAVEPQPAAAPDRRAGRALTREERITARREANLAARAKLREERRAARRQAQGVGARRSPGVVQAGEEDRDPFYREMERLVEVDCDEAALDRK